MPFERQRATYQQHCTNYACPYTYFCLKTATKRQHRLAAVNIQAFSKEVSSGAVNNINAGSTAEPRHCDCSRFLRFLDHPADCGVTNHWTVHMEALRQCKRVSIIHMQSIIQSTSYVTTNEWIPCRQTSSTSSLQSTKDNVNMKKEIENRSSWKKEGLSATHYLA